LLHSDFATLRASLKLHAFCRTLLHVGRGEMPLHQTAKKCPFYAGF
jgi:hypothetical protein